MRRSWLIVSFRFATPRAARYLLARELAQPAHMLIMRRAGSDKEVRRALIGIAAKEAPFATGTKPAG